MSQKEEMDASQEEDEVNMPPPKEPINNVREKRKCYLPGQPLNSDEELVYDPSAYVMLHKANTGSPCLSFDIVLDCYGNKREEFPLTAYLAAGTQSDRPNNNSVIVMKTAQHGDTVVCGVWSDQGKVTILDLKPQLAALEDPASLAARKRLNKAGEPVKPLHVFTGHQTEGFAIDWCTTESGVLATGDCRRNIHLWKPAEGGTWIVDQRPLVGHTASVEDLNWSPNEPSVLASCSVDKTIRIWDARESPAKACKLTVEAHTSDVNVISWNTKEPLIVSGGDDGFLHVWDLRQFKTGSAVASLKHHTGPVSSVAWQPDDSSVMAAAGEDDQISLWDLAVERDDMEVDDDTKDLPPQLLFIHQGQTEIKELHWHPQLPGVVISTANSGFNIFRTISV